MFSPLLHSFGLDISDRSAKLIALQPNFRNELIVRTWGRCEFVEGAIEQGEIKQKDTVITRLTDMMASMTRSVRTPYVVASLPESKTFIKVIEVDAAGDTQHAVMEELPNHIPHALDELIIDWSVAHTFDERLMVTVAAVPKSVAESYTDLLTACGLKVTSFEIEAQAIARSVAQIIATPLHMPQRLSHGKAILHRHGAHAAASSPSPAADARDAAELIVDIGATRTSIILIDWSTIQFITSVPLSGIDATQQIASKLKLTFDEAERAKRICGLDEKKCKGVVSGVLVNVLNTLALEVERAIDFYHTHFKRGHPIASMHITGGGANCAHVEKYLESQVSLPVRIGNPAANITVPVSISGFPRTESLSFTTAIGLALREYAR